MDEQRWPPAPREGRAAGVEHADYRETLVAAIPELRRGDWRLRSCRVTEDRKKLNKRILFGQLRYRDGTEPRAQTADVVAKVYGGDRGAVALGALRALWCVGFRPPARYRVTRPYGYSAERGTLVQARAPGLAWADFLTGDERALEAASGRAAAWLVRLQGTEARAGRRGAAEQVAAARRLAGELAAAFPRNAARLELIAARLMELLPREQTPPVPSHGDYHPKNVFLTPGLVTVIDFDTFGLREPAVDVGYAVGQLLIMSAFRTGGFAPGARAALAFWGRYRRLGGAATWARVGAQVARAFLMSLHYELCVFRNGRLDLLDRWPAAMERWMESHGPATLEDLVRDQ